MPFTLTVRCGPRVQRSRHEDLADALIALEARGRELADAAPRRTTTRARRFEPAEQVYARLEVAGPQRLGPTVRAGVDIRGDGSCAAYRGRVRREPIEPEARESAYAALRRALAV
ncbi:MAG TPA: hypothetical protein VFN55_00975 [Solirubrobacteraceae bacterium]|nr:hypothetical protein [Solirubrobacteraceae bacterium]